MARPAPLSRVHSPARCVGHAIGTINPCAALSTAPPFSPSSSSSSAAVAAGGASRRRASWQVGAGATPAIREVPWWRCVAGMEPRIRARSGRPGRAAGVRVGRAPRRSDTISATRKKRVSEKKTQRLADRRAPFQKNSGTQKKNEATPHPGRRGTALLQWERRPGACVHAREEGDHAPAAGAAGAGAQGNRIKSCSRAPLTLPSHRSRGRCVPCRGGALPATPRHSRPLPHHHPAVPCILTLTGALPAGGPGHDRAHHHRVRGRPTKADCQSADHTARPPWPGPNLLHPLQPHRPPRRRGWNAASIAVRSPPSA